MAIQTDPTCIKFHNSLVQNVLAGGKQYTINQTIFPLDDVIILGWLSVILRPSTHWSPAV